MQGIIRSQDFVLTTLKIFLPSTLQDFVKMPVVIQSYINEATFNAVKDRVEFLKASIMAGTLTEGQEPTTISDPRIRNITLISEVRPELKEGDVRGVHQLAYFITNPADAPGEVKLYYFKAIRDGVTLINAGNRFFKLERGLQKRIGITTDVDSPSNPAAIVEIDISFDLSVSKQDYRL